MLQQTLFADLSLPSIPGCPTPFYTGRGPNKGTEKVRGHAPFVMLATSFTEQKKSEGEHGDLAEVSGLPTLFGFL